MRRLLCVLLVACHAKAPTAAGGPNPATIMASLAVTYRTAPSYQDTGNVATVFLSDGERRTLDRPFEIAFVRGGVLRFEFREGDAAGSAHVVWSDGTHTLVDRGTGAEEARDLGSAIGGAAGVSGGSSHRTPQLLLPDRIGGYSLVELNGVRIDGTEPIDGRPCWRIVGAHPRSGTVVTLWIDRETHLLRQTFQRDEFPARPGIPAFASETTIRFHPVIGGAIDPARLQPPSRPSWIGVRVEGAPPRVTQVVRDAPAEAAGLQIGDELVSVDGVELPDGPTFVRHVRGRPAGARLGIVIVRDGVRATKTVAVAPRPSSLATSALVGKPAPAFATATLVGTGPTELAALRGKVVVVDFWATWCGPCAITIPHLNELHAKHATSGLAIVGLSSEEPELIKQFAGAQHIAYSIGHDAGDHVADQYLREGVPMFVVIDRVGIVRRVIVGANLPALDAALAEVLAP